MKALAAASIGISLAVILLVMGAFFVTLQSATCTVGKVGTAMTETLEGPARLLNCTGWVQAHPKQIFMTDEPRDDGEHHLLCSFTISGVRRTVRDTGFGGNGYERCQQLANGQTALSE